jgi:hypothetical protein
LLNRTFASVVAAVGVFALGTEAAIAATHRGSHPTRRAGVTTRLVASTTSTTTSSDPCRHHSGTTTTTG